MSHTLTPIAVTNSVSYSSQHFWGGMGGQSEGERKFCLPKEPQGCVLLSLLNGQRRCLESTGKLRVASRTLEAQRNNCEDEKGLLSSDLKNLMPTMKTPTF